MSNSFVTDAINLKSYNLSESDKIIVMYSRDKGLIKGVAKGIKKPQSKLGARMQMLVANKLMLYKGKSLDRIGQAEALNTFSKTRQNMDKIFYSMYVSEIVHNFGVEEDPCSEEIFDILYKALNAISNAPDKIRIITSVLKFQLKMMQISGFGIEFDNCLVCGKKIENEKMAFSTSKGGVICCNCLENIGAHVGFNYKIRDFLKELLTTSFEEITTYEKAATEKVCIVCFNLLKDYISMHCSKKFKTLDMLAQVV
ncbi:DNA repair protein RecO [bacterium]|nr:DNA repair protein RecO [bacterium]